MKSASNYIATFALLCILTYTVHAQSPNIMLIIADDLGVDYTNGYHDAVLKPTTPTLDSLRDNGITFKNVFSAPKCTPTRASIMSGKHGIKTGVLGTPGNLDLSHSSIFNAISEETDELYTEAVIGKWHISSQPIDPLHPIAHGADYYTGVIEGTISDYYAWERTEDGQSSIDNTYVTTVLTDNAIDWIDEQNKPWFLWLAHIAPHSPYHVPPADLYTIDNTNSNKRKYIAMIEAMDHEIGRLLGTLSAEQKQNTLIIYIGDNGTPSTVLQDYPAGHGKSTLYQGGIRVPMFISGAGVTRIGESESALINLTDIYATLLEVAGADLTGGIYNSLSFEHLLDGSLGATRDYNYAEFEENGIYSYTIRDQRYKLIESVTEGTQEFYDLLTDSLETTDLLTGTLSLELLDIKADLEAEALQISTAWSCRDHIQNGDESGIDCGGTYCSPCINTTDEIATWKESIKVYPNPTQGIVQLSISSKQNRLEIYTIQGKLIYTRILDIGDNTIDLRSNQQETYLFKITNLTTGQESTRTITKL